MRLIFFLRLFAWFSLRHLRRHPGRAAAVLLGIALGAAVFTSVRLSINASLDAFSQSMDLFTGTADRVIANPGGYVPETLVAELLRHPAVESATPVMTAYVQDQAEIHPPFLLIGLDALLDRPFRKWTAAGEETRPIDLITHPFTLLAGDPLARRMDFAAGDTLRLRHADRTQVFEVADVLTPAGLALVDGGYVAVTDIATFQEFTGRFGRVDRIDLKMHDPASEAAQASIRERLPPGAVLAPPGDAKAAGEGMIRAYQLNLSVLSFVSLFVGMFLIYSLVALNAASRRRELAILRAVGASGRMVFLLFLCEGAFFGLAGWLLALPAGAAMVTFLLDGVGRTISTLFVRVYVDELALSPWEVGISFIVTLTVAVLAALEPAREAMRVSPMEALSTARHRATPARNALGVALLGLILIATVWPLSRLPGIAGVPVPGYVATFTLFAGFSLLSPFFLRLIGRRASPLLRRAFGEPAHLAGRYLKESGTRVAVSVGALITAVALFAALVIMIHSFRSTVELWVTQTVSGDLFVTPRLGEVNRHRNVFPQPTADALAAMAPNADKVPFRRFYLTYGTTAYQFEAIDFEPFFRHGGYLWIDGDPDTLGSALQNGDGCIVSEVFANRTGLRPGDRFRDHVAGLVLDLPILGIIRDYRSQGGVVFFSMHRFQSMRAAAGLAIQPDEWSGIRYFFKPGTPDVDRAVQALVTQIIDRFGNQVSHISGRDLRRNILRVFDETFAITTVLLVIALIVAALGIATTLAVSVLERSHQLNTIFAVGGSHGQIRSMIFWEASLMVLAGELGGLLCGLILSWLLVFVINRQSFGWTFLYGIDWPALAGAMPLIFGAALMAALPAVRMVFLHPPATLLRER